MEVAKLPFRLAPLLAGLAIFWTFLRRLRGKAPAGSSSRSTFSAGPAKDAAEDAPAQVPEGHGEDPDRVPVTEGGPPEACAAATDKGVEGRTEPEPEKEAGAVEDASPEELAGAGSAAATAAGVEANGAAETPPQKAATGPDVGAAMNAPPGETATAEAVTGATTEAPATEARKLPENPSLEHYFDAAVSLHARSRETLNVEGAVETGYVPDASHRNSVLEFSFPRSYFWVFLATIELVGVQWLLLASLVDFGARLAIVVMCLLVGAAGFALAMVSHTRRVCNSLTDAVHAVTVVQDGAAAAVWKAAVAWVQQAPGGVERGLAWRKGVAFLVEVEAAARSGAAAQYLAFVLEEAPLAIHHYIVRPSMTSAAAPEAAKDLQHFLGRAGAGNAAIVKVDGLQSGDLGRSAVSRRQYSKVRPVLSQKDTGYRLTEMPTLELNDVVGWGGFAQDASVFVCPSSRMPKQWLGFGGSFTEASAVTFAKMGTQHQEEALQAYFNPQTGIGYAIGRIPMGSCDFGLGNWTCGNLADGDHQLKGFSIDRYHQAILPLYKRAVQIAGAPLWLLASPWSPPLWMKTKRQWNGDAHLRPDCGRAWALHFVRFVQEMAKVGVPITAVSVQNEPEAAQTWETCIYTATEERNFVRDHLGPSLHEAGLDSVKILIWDHNRDGMLERAQVAYADPEAAKYIWGCAYHWYGDARFELWPDRAEIYYGDRQREWQLTYELKSRLGFDNLRRVAELQPEKHILFTEGCQELSGIPLESVLHEWKFGERYAMNIIADLNNGCEGWIDWNLFLNERGGPNHVENNCLAPIIYDTQKRELIYTPAYFFLGHFSRYIRPGARRVLCSASRDVLEITGFVNPDETIVVVVLNQSGGGVDFKLKVGGEGTAPIKGADVHSPANSVITFIIE